MGCGASRAKRKRVGKGKDAAVSPIDPIKFFKRPPVIVPPSPGIQPLRTPPPLNRAQHISKTPLALSLDEKDTSRENNYNVQKSSSTGDIQSVEKEQNRWVQRDANSLRDLSNKNSKTDMTGENTFASDGGLFNEVSTQSVNNRQLNASSPSERGVLKSSSKILLPPSNSTYNLPGSMETHAVEGQEGADGEGGDNVLVMEARKMREVIHSDEERPSPLMYEKRLSRTTTMASICGTREHPSVRTTVSSQSLNRKIASHIRKQQSFSISSSSTRESTNTFKLPPLSASDSSAANPFARPFSS